MVEALQPESSDSVLQHRSGVFFDPGLYGALVTLSIPSNRFLLSEFMDGPWPTVEDMTLLSDQGTLRPTVHPHEEHPLP